MDQQRLNERNSGDTVPFIRASAPGGTVRFPREWLGLKELSFYADLSERTLRSWIYSPVDALPAVEVRGKVLVRRSDFDAYLQRHRVKRLNEINLDAIVNDVVNGVRNGR
jgi:hypothetical protein